MEKIEVICAYKKTTALKEYDTRGQKVGISTSLKVAETLDLHVEGLFCFYFIQQ